MPKVLGVLSDAPTLFFITYYRLTFYSLHIMGTKTRSAICLRDLGALYWRRALEIKIWFLGNLVAMECICS